MTREEWLKHFTRQFNGEKITEEDKKERRKKNEIEETSIEEVKNEKEKLTKGRAKGRSKGSIECNTERREISDGVESRKHSSSI